MASNSGVSFFSLSAELRNLIYEHYFSNLTVQTCLLGGPLASGCGSQSKRTLSNLERYNPAAQADNWWENPFYPAIFRVSPRFRQEALTFFFELTTFVVDTREGLAAFKRLVRHGGWTDSITKLVICGIKFQHQECPHSNRRVQERPIVIEPNPEELASAFPKLQDLHWDFNSHSARFPSPNGSLPRGYVPLAHGVDGRQTITSIGLLMQRLYATGLTPKVTASGALRRNNEALGEALEWPRYNGGELHTAFRSPFIFQQWVRQSTTNI